MQTFSRMYNIRKLPAVKDDRLSCSLVKNAKIHNSKFIDFYGKTEESCEANTQEKLISAFKGYFNNLEETQIHSCYICKFSRCHDMMFRK